MRLDGVPPRMAEQDRRRTITVWVLAGLLALAFTATGASKLARPDAAMEEFEGWGYPGGFAYVIGAIELVAGLLVLWPRTAPYAAGVLLVDMAGAAITHATNAEAIMIPVNVVLGGIAAALAWLRRPTWVERLGGGAASA